MSEREVQRAGVLAEVVSGRMRQGRAAEVLGLSVQQVARRVSTVTFILQMTQPAAQAQLSLESRQHLQAHVSLA